MLRAYQVGFGDCFLLSFEYGDGAKLHILIDFGSTGLPKEMPEKEKPGWMLRVARDIREQCRDKNGNPKLHVLVATHRHKDHISGFSTDKVKGETESTGEIINSLKPDLVIQPWTEDPDLKDEDLKQKFDNRMIDDKQFRLSPEKHFVATLQDMHGVAGVARLEAENSLRVKRRNGFDFVQTSEEKTDKQLLFMGDNNLPNESAVLNLRAMAKRRVNGKPAGRYVHFGDKISLSQIIPGVKVRVLGPPTLEQHGAIIKQRSRDEDEFWMLHSMLKNYWRMQSATAAFTSTFDETEEQSSNRIFPNARIFQNFAPSQTRWFINRIRAVRTEQLLGLVRVVDKAMNNTSVILMFEIGSKKLLFPGDAQIENWEYALGQPAILEFLKDTDLYKVGHHGSRNATPKTLWRKFAKKNKDDNKKDRLQSVNSTMEGKHGHTPQTAVPRKTLVEELNKFSDYHTTQKVKIEEQKLCQEIPIEL